MNVGEESSSAQRDDFRATLATFAFTSPVKLRTSSRILAREVKVGESAEIVSPPPSPEKTAVIRKRGSATPGRQYKSRVVVASKDEGPSASTQQRTKRQAARSTIKRGYASPEKYAHLNYLPDHLKEELCVMFCGCNPGVKSAQIGHHFAHPTNHFWRCLHGSKLTDAREALDPREDYTLPERYNFGLTNLVERPSAEAGELANGELSAGVPELLGKIKRLRPRIVCFVGKGLWDAFERVVSTTIDSAVAQPASPKKRVPFQYDIQPHKALHTNGAVHETLFFVLPSTSARVTSHQLHDKIEICKILKRRLEDLKAGKFDTASMTIIPLP